MSDKNFYIKRNETVLDIVADAEGLADRDPAIGLKMDNIVGVRKDHDMLATRVVSRPGGGRDRPQGFMGAGNEYQHVARIPDGLLAALLAVEPNFLKDDKIFYPWLRRHREFSALKKAGT